MREYTPVSPCFWQSKRVRGLASSDARLALIYLITSPHQTAAGCCKVPDSYAAHDLGWRLDQYRDSLQALIDAQLIFSDEETDEVMIDGWFQHVPTVSGNHKTHIERMIANIESDTLREMAEAEFSTCIESRKPADSQKLGSAVATTDRLLESRMLRQAR